MSLSSAIDHLLKAKRISAPSQSYRKDNPAEYAKVEAYLKGGARPTGVTTEMGLGLLEIEDVRRAEPPSNAYFNETFVNISNPEWETVQTYSGSFNPGSGVQQDSSGRLSMVAAPDGTGRALRFEIRNSDPGWANDTSVHRCQLGASTQSIWNQSVAAIGDVRWFDFELWLPDEFDWARDWNAMIGIHPSSSTGWGCFNIVIEPYSNSHPHWIQFKLAGGSPPGSTANLRYHNLIQLSNADGSIYAPNRNRRISLIYGGKFNPDGTGWAEAWVDGVNVLPRENGPTCWTDDFHQYMKLGPYKNRSPQYPSGKTVLYVTRASIGYNRPF
jgi:hypothetical protein